MTAAARKPRPRRIAADEAHAWARNLRLRNPIAKLVLCMLTQYVNGDGVCFVGVPSLADDCELAQETVRKRLAWLEQVGALARFPQWIDDAGVRNGSERGRRTTDEIRLLLAADVDDIEARAHGENPDEQQPSADADPPQDRVPDPPPHGGSNPAGTLAGLQRPSTCVEGLDSSNCEPEDSPQPPKGGTSDDVVEGWEEFKAAFEGDGEPILRVSIANTLFAALTWPHERQRATRAAKGLIAYRGKHKRPGPKPSAQTFLRERASWEAFERHDPGGTGGPQDQMTVTKNSREGRAWRALWMISGLSSPMSFTVGGDECFILPREKLTPQVLALADSIDERGRQVGRWHEPQLGNEIGAWREVVKSTIGRTVGGSYGVPASFPPRVDGTWPEFNFAKTG